jgi:hypothetical protein
VQPGLELYYDAGNPVASTLSVGTGPNGRDRVTLPAPLVAGAVLWCNFVARRIFRVTFEADNQPVTRDLGTGYYGFSTRMLGEKKGVW